ncbi:hypothetical protein NQZ68_027806 [Dissostichus eleginoides]|nr:hypothetical protein NQZ68_027806 [Dissostichus eleginoides]
MCPWRLKTPQPLTNRSSTLGQTELHPRRIWLSSMLVTDGSGSVGAIVNAWAQMLGQGGVSSLVLGLMPPHPKAAAMQDSCSLRGCT